MCLLIDRTELNVYSVSSVSSSGNKIDAKSLPRGGSNPECYLCSLNFRCM